MHKTTALLHAIQAGGLVTRSAPNTAERLKEIQSRGLVQRVAEVVSVDETARTVELSFSSETRVTRWWGEEVLSHDPAHVRLGRLLDGGALLWNHDWDDQRGVVESARIDGDRKGRAVVRFGTSEKAEELWQDVKGKIKRHVSVGYFIHAIKLIEEREGVETYLATDWEPYEISIVSVPADVNVGIGRTAEIPDMERTPKNQETPGYSKKAPQSDNRNQPDMKFKNIRNAAGDLVKVEIDDAGNVIRDVEVLEYASDTQRSLAARGATGERARVSEITSLGERYGRHLANGAEMVRTAIADGTSPADFQGALLAANEQRMSQPLNDQNASADIGMSEREVSQFSLLRVVRALADPTSTAAREAAAMEFRASDAARERMGRDDNGSGNFMIPSDVLRRAVGGDFSRAALSTSATTGGNGGVLVEHTLQTGSFIDILRRKNVVMQYARVLAGLVGNVDIPKQIAAAVAYWIGEGQDAQETGIAFGQLSLKPKTLAAFTDITRRMSMQSSMDVESMLRTDLAVAMATAIDYAAYYGPGTEYMPKGITNHDGINAVAFATPGRPTYGELVDMETAVALDDADVDGMRFIAAAGFRGRAKQTVKFPTQTDSATIWEPGNTVNGYPVSITNQVAASDVLFGNFNDMIVAMWGGLEINVDRAALAKSGGLRIIAFQDVDIALRRTESFVLGR